MARKQKEDMEREKKGLPTNAKTWKRKMPYDFTGCLAHMDLTYDPKTLEVVRITGVLSHNQGCQKKDMARLPPVPLHPHVYQVAVQQVNEGATYENLHF